MGADGSIYTLNTTYCCVLFFFGEGIFNCVGE